MSSAKLIARDIIVDPARLARGTALALGLDLARTEELIDAERGSYGTILKIGNERGEVGYRYDALPAAAAAEPTAFGCIECELEGGGGLTTLIALLWDGAATRLHNVSPVDARTSTVAEAGGATNALGGGLVCPACDRADTHACTAIDCPALAPEDLRTAA